MLTDLQGCPLAGATPEAAARFDESCENFARFCGDPVAPLTSAIEASPAFAMARLAKAAIYATSTEPGAVKAARRMLAETEPLLASDRDRAHFASMTQAVDGNLTRAGDILAAHSQEMPRDRLALLIGHQIDFLTADAARLQARIDAALPHWAGVPGESYLHGMRAFGLEECGDYVAAEIAGRKALDADPGDCWAHHAVAHVMEMQGRAGEARDWISAREAHWAQPDNFLKVHNWWHLALCHLELGDGAGALAVYDTAVWAEPSSVAMNLVDAAALLWRVSLSGIDPGQRWAPVADAWTAHADGALYPFNDVHAALAYIGAGRLADLDALVTPSAIASGETASWVRSIGQPVIAGLADFHRGDYPAATRRLYPQRQLSRVFGGSHAQRDIIHWTLTEAALRAGDWPLAAALIAERTATRPHSAVNRAFLSRLPAVGETGRPA